MCDEDIRTAPVHCTSGIQYVLFGFSIPSRPGQVLLLSKRDGMEICKSFKWKLPHILNV